MLTIFISGRGFMPRLLSVVAFLLFCPVALVAQTSGSKTARVSNTLVARAQEWVDTWINKDVKRMRRLHADDVSSQLYGIGDDFDTMERLLNELREGNFWNVSWSIKIVEPRVRILGADAALVAFRLVGSETPKDGTTRPYSAAISLIFQRVRGEWLIVHVHDSSGPAPGSGTDLALTKWTLS